MLDRFKLDGRVAVITGGAKGIGWAIAEALSDAGAKIEIADIDTDAAAEAAGRLRSMDREANGTQLPDTPLHVWKQKYVRVWASRHTETTLKHSTSG